MSENESKIVSPNINTEKITIQYIFRDKIHPDKNQIRKDFNEKHIETLKKSIQADGLKDPLHVVKDSGDKEHYTIVDGECRFRASEEILNELPCIIETQDAAAMWALKANIMRLDLNPIEKMRFLCKTVEKFKNNLKKGQSEKIIKHKILEEINISDSLYLEILSLQHLPEDIKTKEEENSIVPLRKLKTLATKKMINNPELLRKKYEEIKDSYLKDKKSVTVVKKDPEAADQRRIKHFIRLRTHAKKNIELYKEITFDRYNVAEKQMLLKCLTDS